MKGKLCWSFALAIVIVSVNAGLAMSKLPGSALDNVPRLLHELEKAGFSSQEGTSRARAGKERQNESF